MANALAFIGKRIQISNRIIKRFTCTLSGSYVQGLAIGVAGETLAFNSATNTVKGARPKIPNGGATGQLVPATDIEVSAVPNGYAAQVELNAVSPTAANYVMRIFSSSGTELAAGAYPAGLTGAPMVIEVAVPTKYN